MTSADFCYWLQGYFEISETKELNEKQTQIVKNHLNLVFRHNLDGIAENDIKTALQNLHDGPTAPGKHNDPLARC